MSYSGRTSNPHRRRKKEARELKRLLPHLITLVGILLLLYLAGEVQTASQQQMARTFKIPIGLELLKGLLFALMGLLLRLPTLWGRVDWPLRFDWPMLALYTVVGGVLMGLPLVSGLGPRWIISYTLIVGGSRGIGGLLIGYGIARAIGAPSEPDNVPTQALN